jgi:N6-adenosine-specific RNA methylase IME4
MAFRTFRIDSLLLWSQCCQIGHAMYMPPCYWLTQFKPKVQCATIMQMCHLYYCHKLNMGGWLFHEELLKFTKHNHSVPQNLIHISKANNYNIHDLSEHNGLITLWENWKAIIFSAKGSLMKMSVRMRCHDPGRIKLSLQCDNVSNRLL